MPGWESCSPARCHPTALAVMVYCWWYTRAANVQQLRGTTEDRTLRNTNKKVSAQLGIRQAGEADTELPCKGFCMPGRCIPATAQQSAQSPSHHSLRAGGGLGEASQKRRL